MLKGRTADVEGKGAQGVELVLGERREGQVVDRPADGQQVVKQQGLGVGLIDLDAFAGSQGMAIADRPAAIGQAGWLTWMWSSRGRPKLSRSAALPPRPEVRMVEP